MTGRRKLVLAIAIAMAVIPVLILRNTRRTELERSDAPLGIQERLDFPSSTQERLDALSGSPAHISDYMCLQLALVGGPLGPKIMTYI